MSIVPVPPPTKAQLLDYFDRTVKDAHSVGLTSIHDAGAQPHMVEFFQEYVIEMFTTSSDFRPGTPRLGNFLYVPRPLGFAYAGIPHSSASILWAPLSLKNIGART